MIICIKATQCYYYWIIGLVFILYFYSKADVEYREAARVDVGPSFIKDLKMGNSKKNGEPGENSKKDGAIGNSKKNELKNVVSSFKRE